MILLLFQLLAAFILCPLVLAIRTCTVPAHTTLIHDAQSQQVKPNLAHPRPLVTCGTQKRRLVKYCYAPKIYRDYLHCAKVIPGFMLWSEKLEYPVSSQTGHGLGWEENVVLKEGRGGVRQYCYKDYKRNPPWNKRGLDEGCD